MKKFYSLSLLVSTALSLGAKDMTLGGQDFAVDTIVRAHQVGPGTTYAHYRVPAKPLAIHVLEMDMTNPYLTMEAWNGGQAAVACETPTSVYSRYQKEGLQVVACHNGDFFTTNLNESGISRMGLVGAGDVIFNPTGNPLFVIDENNHPWIDHVNFSGTLSAGDATTRIHTVNQLRLEWETGTHANQLSLYTPAFGSKMHANSTGGTVAVVKPATGSVAFPVNKPIQMTVVERLANPGQIAIPEDGAVLHGVGESASWLDNLQPGQTVTVSLGATLPSYPDVKTIRDAIGGSGHIILRNGQITNINNPDCHPRTFMGISQDAKTIWSVVIDGRWPGGSIGIDLDDQGRVLQWLGAWDGINLDGGGSSCMVVNEEVKNHPSDGPIRAVGNGVIFYSMTPRDWNLTKIAFPPMDYLNLPVGAWLHPQFYGFNKYGVLVTKNATPINLSTSDPIGRIWSDYKTITMSTTPASGTLYAEECGYNNTTSTPVKVVFAKAKSITPNYTVSNCTDLPMSLYSKVGAHDYLIDPLSIEWEIEDPTVVSLNWCGDLQAGRNGTTRMIGKSPHFNDTITVSSESFGSNLGGYTHDVLYGVPVGTLDMKQSGGTSLKASEADRGFYLSYTGNGSARGCYIQLADSTGKITTKGTPKRIFLTINPGSAPVKQISMNYTDNLGNRGTLTFHTPWWEGEEILEPVANKENKMVVELPWTSPDGKDYCIFPITFSGLRLTMGTSTKNTEYKIEIPELYYSYPFRSGVDEIEADETPAAKPEGTFDMNGRRVSDEPTTPGLYIRNGEKILVK